MVRLLRCSIMIVCTLLLPRLLGTRLPDADGSANAGDSVIAAADGVGQL